jgi:hypothetical protein
MESAHMHPRKRILVFGGVLGLGVVVVVIILLRSGNDQTGLFRRITAITALDRGDVASQENREQRAAADKRLKGPIGPTVGVNPGLYNLYLNQLCAPLTAAEEDKLIAESGGDPNVLLALVFARSPRSEQWLREALRKAPENPLVHYAVLSKTYPGFDRLRSALELARLAPQDASPLHAAALQSLRRGDREGAIAYLRDAAGREQFSTLFGTAREAAVDAYQLAGRAENDARARVLLEGVPRFEGVTISQLERELGLISSVNARPSLTGKEELGALVLDGYQKALYSQGLDLNAYHAARGMETEYLRAFLYTASTVSDRAIAEQYFPAPISEMFKEAQTEWNEAFPMLVFSQDRPGIYQRLNGGEKAELINRIVRDGELSAYRWAYQARPDIFRSPNFVPQGVLPETWKGFVTQTQSGVSAR